MATAQLKAIISANARAFNRTMGQIKSAAFGTARALSGIAVTGGIFATREAVAFEKQMAEVNTIAGVGKKALTSLKRDVIDLGVELGATTEELTGGLYQALSAGVKHEDAIDFLRTSAKAAVGGVTDVKTAVDGLTTIINSYGLESKDAELVADKLFQTVKGGKTTFAELAANVGKTATIASSAGVSLDEFLGMIVQLTKSGVKTEEAMTGIKAAITSLTKPTDAAKKEIKNINNAFGDGAFESFSFAKKLELLAGRAKGGNDKLFKLFTNIRAMIPVLKASGPEAEKLAEEIQKMAESTGAGNKAFETMAQTASQRLKIARAEVQAMVIGLGDDLVPVLDETLTAMRDTFSSDDAREGIEGIAIAIAAAADGLKVFMDLVRALKDITNEVFDNPAFDAFLTKALKLSGITDKNAGVQLTTQEIQAGRSSRRQGLRQGADSIRNLGGVARNKIIDLELDKVRKRSGSVEAQMLKEMRKLNEEGLLIKDSAR